MNIRNRDHTAALPTKMKHIGASRTLIKLFIALGMVWAVCIHLPASAWAATTAFTKDGLKSADLASCVIVGDLSDYHFQTNDASLFIDRPSTRYIYFAYTPKVGTTSLGTDKWFQLDYERAVLDTNGHYHDLHVRFSNVQARWKDNPNLPAIRQRMVTCYKDRVSIDVKNSWTYNDSYASVSTTASANTWAGLKADVAVWAGNDTDPVSLAYNLFVTDIDVRDFFTNNYTGAWAESITLGDMFGKVHVEKDTYLALSSGRIRGTQLDENTYRSGFVSLGTMSAESPMTFTWTASQAGTSLFINWSHLITAKAGQGGSIAIGDGSGVMLDTTTHAADDGVYQTQTEVEAVPGNDYLVKATPSYGYDILEMTLDGVSQGAVDTVTIPAISADHTVCATFVPKRGKLALEKTSAMPELTEGNTCYSLEGATYEIYADESCTNLEATVTTDEHGVTEPVELPIGRHWLKETQAPLGYALDEEVHEVEVVVGITSITDMSDMPQHNPVEVVVQKVDAQTGKAIPQGAAQLADAEFDVHFYAGIYEQAELPETPTRSWTLVTDDQGQALLAQEYVREGDELYLSADGTPTLPLGTVVIEEVKAPSGYALPENAQPVIQHITAEGTLAEVHAFVEPDELHPTVADEVLRGGLLLRKVDANGGGGLPGATFSVTNQTGGNVVVDGTEYAPGEVCLLLTSEEDGIAASDEHVLPPGTYHIAEQAAPRGYQKDESWMLEATIPAEGGVVDLTEQPAANERIIVPVSLSAHKNFDGASQGRTLEEGMFSFELCDEEGTVLQVKQNDDSGAVRFDPLAFDIDDLNVTHTYEIHEIEGDDPEIVYDTHSETISITIQETNEQTLTAKVETDEDGIVFHNRTVSALEMPFTGGKGTGAAGTSIIVGIGAVALLAMRRWNESMLP